MKQFVSTLFALSFIATLLFSCGTGTRKETKKDSKNPEKLQPIMVFAAAGVSEPLNEIIDSFELKYPVKVQTNYASSGTLARQIEQQELPGLFISASKKWMNYVDSLRLVVNREIIEIAHDKLVLISPLNSTVNQVLVDSSLNLKKLLGDGMLSLGDPAHVPAGEYARQSLKYYGWLSLVEKKMLKAKDVRSAVMVVEMEEVPLGIAYYTVASKSEKVNIIGCFPENAHKPIVFTAAICKQNKYTTAFFNFLNSPVSNVIWKKYGFTK